MVCNSAFSDLHSADEKLKMSLGIWLCHMCKPFNTGQLPTFDFSPLEAGNVARFSDVALQKII